ncbi:LamG domain-containing protein, partial [bacterium]|nr:LamG domain-containing protein [bacterium]
MLNYSSKNNKQAFTFIELLIVIAIIAIITTVIFIALNPLQRFKDARNAQRWQDVEAIADSIRLYQIDNEGQIPTGLDENWRMLGTDIIGCDISCGNSGGGTSSFVDDTSTTFNAGSYSDNTQWDNGNTWVELTAAGQISGTGTYTSSIRDANSSITWSTLSWIPERPTGKPLPNNRNSESAYTTGNANMSNNILLMHLDELSGAILDSSGNSNNGTNSGAAYGVSGKFNTAMDFDGVNNIITGPSSNDITGDNLQIITLSAWIKHTDSGDNGYITSIKRSSTASTLIALDAGNTGAGNLGFLTRHADNSTHTWLNHSGGYNDGQWHHLVAVVNNASRILYIDGVQRNSDNNGIQSVSGNTSEFTVGGFHSTNPIAFDGQIDEVAIWRRALSPTEILDNYKRGALRLK